MPPDSRAYAFGGDGHYYHEQNYQGTSRDSQHTGEYGDKRRNNFQQKFRRTASKIFNPYPAERKANPGQFNPTRSTPPYPTHDDPHHQAPIIVTTSETSGEWANTASEQIREAAAGNRRKQSQGDVGQSGYDVDNATDFGN